MKKLKAAVLSHNCLGDGLLALTLGLNLSNNGFEVTIFNNYVAQISDIIPAIKCHHFIDNDQSENILGSYDIVCFDPDVITHLSTHEPINHSNYKFILCHQEYCKEPPFNSMTKEKSFLIAHSQLKNYILYKVNLRAYITGKQSTILDCYRGFMTDCLKLDFVDTNINFNITTHYQYKKHSKRVVIFPYSGHSSKDWKLSKFTDLGTRLNNDGYDVFFAITKKQSEIMDSELNKHNVVAFDSLKKLLFFIYESSIVISNDSGGGHLASSLNIPTITITNFSRSSYLWAPGWAKNTVISPLFRLRPDFLRNKYWHHLISIPQIVSVIKNDNHT